MKVVKSDGFYTIHNEVEINDFLETKNYSLTWDLKNNCALADAPSFSYSVPFFDYDANFVAQIAKTFRSIDRNVGVLLQGYKGQGKTVTAKKICEAANVPVVMINRPIPKVVDFSEFLNDIHQPIVVFIDEFEKVFPSNWGGGKEDISGFHTQDSFLTIMDGANNSMYQRLFVLTSNDDIGDKFLNRPSRIRYRKFYNFMPKEMYDDVIETKLRDKSFREDLMTHLPLADCTIDLLTTVIEEINLHKMPYSSFKEVFNHSPRKITYQRWEYINNTFEFKDYLELSEEVTNNTRYIWNQPITIVKVEGPYIFYKVTEKVYDDDDENDKGKTVTVFYRIKKSIIEGAYLADGKKLDL